MAAINGFKDLIAWQKGMDLAVAVYTATRAFPAEERFGLTAQARRASVGIPSNVAEGYGRRTKQDYMHFLDIAKGSANELEPQLLLGARLGFGHRIERDSAIALAREEQRILAGLLISLERSTKSSSRP